MAVYLLVCVWLILALKTLAFKPTIGQGDDPSMYTHESITLEGVDRAAAYFLTSRGILNTTKANHDEIIKDFFGTDTNGYNDYKQRSREFAAAVMNVYKAFHKNPDYTVNSERIHEAHSLVQTTSIEIASIITFKTLDDVSLKLLVDKVGKCLMIIQSFYSNTNWIEMMVNGGESFLSFGSLASTNMVAAQSGTVTCRNCDYSKPYGCSKNLLVTDRLTSGYLYGQQFYPKPVAHSDATEGKCSHGGINDAGRNTAATGGINKETLDWNWSPHAHLHNISGYTAVRATEAFFMSSTSGFLRTIVKETVKYIFNLKKTINQKGSLGFVIDVTGSMAGDIQRVKDACIARLTSVIGTVNEPNNFVLATFSDPASLTTVATTTDGHEMIRWIEALTVDGGGDCQEFALSGIKAAIDACDPFSLIIVATDADAKDEQMADTVISAAKAKNISVTFLQTGQCTLSRLRREIQMPQHSRLSVFESLAANTGGDVYHIDHSEVTAVLDHILEENFPSSEGIIDYFVQKTTDIDTMDITIDSEAAVLVITITGPYSLSQASLSSPDGTVQSFTTAHATQYYSSHKITMSIQKPSAGIWMLTRRSSGSWTVNVTASTYMYIDSQLKEIDDSGTSYVLDRNPIMGKNYTVEVLAYNLNSTARNFTLHLLDEEGVDIFNRPLDIIFGSSKINGYIPIIVPSKNFFVQLSGIDQNGFKFKRMSRKVTKPVGVDLVVQPINGNLGIGVPANITFTLYNLGANTQTYTISIVDNKGRVQSPTSQKHTVPGGNSITGSFLIMTSVASEYVTYTVSVTLPGSTDPLQSSTSTVMSDGAFCSSVVTKKCKKAYTGSNCSLYTWSARAVFSFNVSRYVNVANVSMTINSDDRKRVDVSGNCCLEDFTVKADPTTGDGCETSQPVIASDQETNDVVTDEGSGISHLNVGDASQQNSS